MPPPFEEALARHEREIMRFLLRTTRNREDALDLFQDTWLRAYRAYPELDSEAGLRPWLFRIASNLCRNRSRDLGRRSRAIADGAANSSGHERPVGVPIEPGTGARALDLKRAIMRLPPRQAEAFVMRKFVGLDYAEIGSALGSARASVCLALRKLKPLR